MRSVKVASRVLSVADVKIIFRILLNNVSVNVSFTFFCDHVADLSFFGLKIIADRRRPELLTAFRKLRLADNLSNAVCRSFCIKLPFAEVDYNVIGFQM